MASKQRPRWSRRDAANRRVVWECRRDGNTLLAVRDARPLRYWWRVRKDGKNLAKGTARDAMHARQLAERANRKLARALEVSDGE